MKGIELKNVGVYVDKELLRSNFTSDEKLFLAFVKTYVEIPLSLKTVQESLGFASVAKIKNLIKALKEKTSGQFKCDELEKGIYSFSFELETDKTTEQLVETAKAIEESNKPTEKYTEEIKQAIDYLNEVTNSSYKADTKSTISKLNAIFNQKYTLEDVKHVIDVKNAEWGNNKRMRNYLRPSTLFISSKFENYLQQWNKRKDKIKPKQNQQEKQKEKYADEPVFG